ncbi:MAG: glucosyltransferase domain-containing protein [Legionella sp.]|jgi:hypothetical protein
MFDAHIWGTLAKDVRQYFQENKYQISLLLFFTLLAYGYYITHWAISIDSEISTFYETPFSYTLALSMGRFVLYLLTVLSNHHIIPFWNDFISVCFIFLSALIWNVSLLHINNNRQAAFIFSLIYIISPIYIFYLRYTTYNTIVSLGFFLMSLAAYHFIYFLNSLEQGIKQKASFFLCVIYVFIAISIYEMFANYWITSMLLITSVSLVANNINNNQPYFKKSVKQISFGLLILFFSLLLYKIATVIFYHFIPLTSNYKDHYMGWGGFDLHTGYIILKNYFLTILFSLHFNFLIVFTLVSALVFCIYLLVKNIRNAFFILILFGFVISGFLLPIILGYTMPLRTMQTIPLMLAGMWFIIYAAINNWVIKRCIFIFIVLATLLNAQYITRICYGDNLRLQYDINYANRIYNFVLANTGNSVSYKPLVIIGHHDYANSPLIINGYKDTLGCSFFDCGGGSINRINAFMAWLGNDYIFPTWEQQKSAINQTADMANFPDKESIKETKDLIIVKLSSFVTQFERDPIELNFNNYQIMKPEAVNYFLDISKKTNNQLFLLGWAFFKDKNASDTSMFIKLSSGKNNYIFPANQPMREDVANVFKNGSNIKLSGFNRTIDTSKLAAGEYQVSLILTNRKDLSEVKLQKLII